MPRDKVRVLSPYVGGAFGSGLRPQYELPLAVLAARALKRAVRVTLTRQQMFTLGYRAANVQQLALGADNDGKLASFRHDVVAMTSQFEDFQRNFVNWSSLLYRCANSELGQSLVKLDQNTPCDMRGAGRSGRRLCASNARWTSLRYAAKIDPLAAAADQLFGQGPDRGSSLTAASSCANAIDRARRSSAGRIAIRSPAR